MSVHPPPVRDPLPAEPQPESDDLEALIEEARRRARRRRRRYGACALVVTAAGLVGYLGFSNGGSALSQGGRDGSPVAPVKPDIPTVRPATNGWVAADVDRPGGDIYLVRPGEKARRLRTAGSAGGSVACPSRSPDGTRLLYGRVTGSSQTASSSAQLVILRVGSNGATGAAKMIALAGFEALNNDAHPCGTWSPDGRWIALAGPAAPWVVDTHTGDIRRLPLQRFNDLEWRPGTGELAIAGAQAAATDPSGVTLSTPVTIYSTATGELSRLGDVKAAHIAWSPDGKTLAYTGGENDAGPLSLWLVDADGTNKRLLARDRGEVIYGVGPVWSPTGDRIAYQRLATDGEGHAVVLVNVADGTKTTIAPPVTHGSKRFRANRSKQFGASRSERFTWYPYAVWWAPDGTTLLYAAWSAAVSEDYPGPEWAGLIAVPADRPNHATVLIANPNGRDKVPSGYSHKWPIQLWGRQPE